MQVSEATKTAFLSNSIHKVIRVYFPDLDLTLTNNQIEMNSLHVKESVFDGSNFELVGCMASVLTITLYHLTDKVKGEKIQVFITADETDEIPLFTGIVDSVERQSNRSSKKITAYDELYTKGNIDISSWYNSLTFPITISNLRRSLFNYLGLQQESTILPCDSYRISKQYDPKTLQALPFIKNICQLNGVFGIINRYGRFEYRSLAMIDAAYPSALLFPSNEIFPASPSATPTITPIPISGYYRSASYEDFVVHPIDKLQIRQNEQDTGVTVGTGDNKYIIQGNVFTYGLNHVELTELANTIYAYISNISYIPFKLDMNGCPWLECGLDAIRCRMIDDEASDIAGEIIYTYKDFYVFDREFTGTQSLVDSFGAEGEEFQNEFITNIGLSIDLIKQDIDNINSTLSDYDARITALEEGGGGGINVVSVPTYPVSPDLNTLYLIQGTVVIV